MKLALEESISQPDVSEGAKSTPSAGIVGV